MRFRYFLLLLAVGFTARTAGTSAQMPTCPEETLVDHYYQDCVLPPLGYGDTCPLFKTENKRITFLYSPSKYVLEQGTGQNGRKWSCDSLLFKTQPCWPVWLPANYDGKTWSQSIVSQKVNCSSLSCNPLPTSCDQCIDDGAPAPYVATGQCCP
jgi:hypothetical protein